ncbi:pilus assembly protein PilY [Acinetobacter sp. AM]|uniref:PilC/PilY family type IV pilus protein n=1 Tax=Acinetobacter sp. AM TaxID=2170730 RepID=UPI000DE79827|nr:PilC/PilY family type IV pilus protein [Acinetobacter sp. AM]PWB14629.1 pilus assembly protein PilY [Acinetobacter sp. AM]
MKPNKFERKDRTQIHTGAVFSVVFTGTLLIASSVVQATDLQIYAKPSAGKKTIVMMLDTSGSMSYTDSGQTGSRLTRLKNGMYAFLDSNNPTLNEVRVGLGHYSVGGNGRAGRILVAVDKLGPVGSAQRNALRAAVQGLSADGGTPTAHAYAEAAAYLMGTSTRSIATIEKDVYRSQDVNYYSCTSNYPYFNSSDLKCYKRRDEDRRGNYTYGGGSINATFVETKTLYYQCSSHNNTDFNSGTQTCSNWSLLTSAPSDTELAQDGNKGTNLGTIYFKYEEQLNGSNADSGFANSIDSIKNSTKTTYVSPLPAEADRVSCDGQGVYILSDGAANGTSTTRATNVMSTALADYGNGFSCSGGMSDANDPDGNAGGWHCMGEFAKKLFDRTKNPAGVSIQTAFVGFGNDMNGLTKSYVQRACQLSSRSQTDRGGDDACSPGQSTYSVTYPGYGNGGFFTTQSAAGVTDSVIAFINNLGAAPLEPLTTGAISVPVDNLNPNGLQPYGYLRALEPNPQSNKVIWAGNLKKYQVLLSGTNAGAFAAANGTTLVYNADGGFQANTKDLWNSASVYQNESYNDGGIITLGGAYSKVPMPILGQSQNLDVTPKQYAYTANENRLRRLYTDVSATGGATLTNAANGASLLTIPSGTLPSSNITTYILSQFGTQTTLQDFPLLAKQKLLNYLGYSVPLDETATALPTTLTTPNSPYLAMGGSIHSFPVQLTYSGTLDSAGELTSTRSQSVLYGTMDGGLHLVDGETGVEQMVFVPAELLRDTVSSKALVKGQDDTNAPVHGVDGAWVADPAYKTQKATSSSESSMVKARQMNIYGGLRMGGSSYYGLDVLTPTSPKLLFRVGPDISNYSRMGQSWSKPVLANIRYNGAIRRVMIVGGGYDQCYENPSFRLGATVATTDYPDTTCNNKSAAQGNAVYIIDAKTGERIWWASSTGADTNNANMTHSVVSRISALDRDADGLIDHLYFGDLGGQVFRADLNNSQTLSGSTYSAFGVRVARLANLATDGTTGAALTLGKNPRFYEAPTVTIHDQGATTFIIVGLASGNRSTPLDVYPSIGRDGMLPTTALTDRLVNNVYGIIDRDFIKRNLITGSPTLESENKTLANLQKNPQLLSGIVASTFIGTTATKDGWYRSLSSNGAGVERAGGSFRVLGGMKAFEEPVAITGNLIVPVYDPQGTGIAPQNPCLPRVVGETDRQKYCLPFGACLTAAGTVDSDREGPGGDGGGTGFVTQTTCPAGVSECNANAIGSGIRGIAFVPGGGGDGACESTISTNQGSVGKWECRRIVNPTRWYEKWVQ